MGIISFIRKNNGTPFNIKATLVAILDNVGSIKAEHIIKKVSGSFFYDDDY